MIYRNSLSLTANKNMIKAILFILISFGKYNYFLFFGK